MLDTINKEYINEQINLKNIFYEIEVLDSIDSTNNYAKLNPIDKKLIIANNQSKGRGRLGRDFYSQENSGIYLSLVLKANFDIKTAVSLSSLSAIAVVRALEKLYKIKLKIKWVNDILYKGKKLAGILSEAVIIENEISHLIIGIGINVNINAFPADIKDKAISLPKQKSINRNDIIISIISELDSILSEIGEKEFLKEYKSMSAIIDKDIEIIKNNKIKLARAIDIDKDFSLLVQYENGEFEKINSGEVSIRGDFY